MESSEECGEFGIRKSSRNILHFCLDVGNGENVGRRASAVDVSVPDKNAILGFRSSRLPALDQLLELTSDSASTGSQSALSRKSSHSLRERFGNQMRLSSRTITSQDFRGRSERVSGYLRDVPSPSTDPTRLMSHPSLPNAGHGGGWARDLVVYPNNALRREVRNIYAILTALVATSTVNPVDSVETFFGWYGAFVEFLDVYIEAHEGVLYKIAEPRGPVGGMLSESGRKSVHSRLRHLANLVAKSEFRANQSGFEGMYEVLRRAIDKLALVIAGYCNEQEKVLPVLLEQRAASRGSVRREYARRYVEHGSGPVSTVILSRWMLDVEGREGAKLLQQWKHESLGRAVGLKFGFWEKSYMRDETVRYHVEKAQNVKASDHARGIVIAPPAHN